MLQAKIQFLASLYSLAGCSGYDLVANAEDRFSRVNAEIHLLHFQSTED